ncbi:MAG: DUF2628 domain-containing protein [Alphaproteobacteria bacterium GM7ARS4]|nr:DUF2628 domain-containing protein [Alphaproteobacteria bacterium GM7ARS4]
MASLFSTLYVLYERTDNTHHDGGHDDRDDDISSDISRDGGQARKSVVVIPCGFSFAAFFFKGFWALWHRMWSVAITLLALSSSVQSLLVWFYLYGGTRAVLLWGSLLWMGYGLVVGLYAHGWRSSFLYEAGYRPVSVRVRSSHHALTSSSVPLS